MIELSSDADLARRIAARVDAEGQRLHLRCRRCHKAIPDERRSDAAYCSPECHDVYLWERITRLRTEIRRDFRLLTAPASCPCGEPLNNRSGRHGPIARSCKRCRDRAAQQRYRDRAKDSPESPPTERTDNGH